MSCNCVLLCFQALYALFRLSISEFIDANERIHLNRRLSIALTRLEAASKGTSEVVACGSQVRKCHWTFFLLGSVEFSSASRALPHVLHPESSECELSKVLVNYACLYQRHVIVCATHHHVRCCHGRDTCTENTPR